MNITKQRLVQIIKEELEMNGGMEEPMMDTMASPCAVKQHMMEMLSGLPHNEAVDIMMEVADELGLSQSQDPEMAMDMPISGIEEMIANELAEMLANK
jgi:DnaJ-domain-containing protein 1